VAKGDTTIVEPSPLDTDEIPVLVLPAAPRPRAARTWTVGAVAVALVALAAASGLGLLFHYRPLVTAAYPGLLDLAEASRFGFLREIHRWSAHLTLVTVFGHLLRIVVAGAYRPPRRHNYHVGIALFVAVLLLAVTGWILPWNRHSEWLLATFGYESVGGKLAAVFAVHCGILPVVGTLILLHHLLRARRDDEEAAALLGEAG